MGLHLEPGISNDIDFAIWEIYRNQLGGGELTQLAKLFKANGLPQRLTDILSPTLARPHPHYREELEIKLAWIDKRPLAKLKTETSRVELGDAAIFFFDIFKVGQKFLYNHEARALVLQAKVAKEKRQIAQPVAPVNPSVPPGLSTRHANLPSYHIGRNLISTLHPAAQNRLSVTFPSIQLNGRPPTAGIWPPPKFNRAPQTRRPGRLPGCAVPPKVVHHAQ
jgi:hypothetical protein